MKTSVRRAVRSPAPRRGGFTLVEMIVVIGIILFLMSISVLGYRYLEANASKNRTRVYLESANGMVAELDRMGQGSLLAMQLETVSPYTSMGNSTAPTVNVNGVAAPTAPNSLPCQTALQALLQVPKNQTTYNQLPARALVANSATSTLPAALADAWGNALMYVPPGPGGLTGVAIGNSATGTNSFGGTQTVTIVAPGQRGFWVSGGPDGDIATGDDNVYSFEH